MKFRNTKQRQIILEELNTVSSHPSADEIYKMVRGKMPDIGLATVYRTLDYLVKAKKIIKLSNVDQKARYDGNICGHCHLICRKCGKVEDVFDVIGIKVDSEQVSSSGFQIDWDHPEIFGYCKNCK